MATRKLAIQVFANRQRPWPTKPHIESSREFVIILQPQGYDWTVPATTKFEITYESNSPARSENELIEVGEKNNRTVLTVHSDEPVLQVLVNGITELEAKIVNWPEQDYHNQAEQKQAKVEEAELATETQSKEKIDLGIRKLKVKNSLNKEMDLGLEPLGWGWGIVAGELFEAIYDVLDFPCIWDVMKLDYYDKDDTTSLDITSGDYTNEFYFNGKKWN